MRDLTGIYTDLEIDDYHAMEGVSSSELRAWWQSVAHGLDYREDGVDWRPSFDAGHLIHDALLGEELEHEYVWYDATKTRRAKTYKRTCRDKGVIGILPDDVERVQQMRDEIDASPAIKSKWITGGWAEASFFWRHDSGVLLKCRPDYCVEEPHEIHVTELKSVRERYATPHGFAKRIAQADYDLAAALYADGVEKLTGKPVRYRWIGVNKSAPHLPVCLELTPEAREAGRKMYETAIRRMLGWERGEIDCRGYQTEPGRYEVPAWKASAVEEQEQTLQSQLSD